MGGSTHWQKAYGFMVLIGLPGGICTPGQWLTVDRLGMTAAGILERMHAEHPALVAVPQRRHNAEPGGSCRKFVAA